LQSLQLLLIEKQEYHSNKQCHTVEKKNTSSDEKECGLFFGFTYNWNLEEEEDEFSLLFSLLTPQHNKASASKITGKWFKDVNLMEETKSKAIHGLENITQKQNRNSRLMFWFSKN